MSFCYRSLDPGRMEIRLLKILAAGKSPDDDICVTITHCSLLDAPRPEYKTTSYCWGDSTERKSILVNDKPLAIPVSSYQLISALRKSDEDIIVWIDAVCINQLDMREREQQVQLMGEVYRYSAGNFVYLGPEEYFMGDCLAAFDTIKQEVLNEHGTTESFFERIWTFAGGFILNDRVTSSVDMYAEGLVAFLELPLFRRLWIRQEVVLAPHNQAISGSYSFDFDDVLLSTAWMCTTRIALDSPLNRCRGHRYAATAFVYRSLLHQGSDKCTLEQVLQSARDMEMQIKSDMVFGSLGISEWTLAGRNLPSLLKPNYDKPFADVLRDATRAIIEEYRTLDILAYVSPVFDEELTIAGRSTWVPHWERQNAVNMPNCLPSNFQTCGTRDLCKLADDGVFDEHEEMSLRGYRLGQIVELSEIWNWSYWNRDQPAVWVHRIEAAEAMIRAVANAGEDDQKEILARSMIADTSRKFHRAGKFSLHGLEAFRALYNAGPFPRAEDIKLAVPYVEAVVHACSYRRFCGLDSGMVGLVPQVASKDDIVVVLQGGQWPFVLRPVEDYYLMIGQAYIDLVMDGAYVTRIEEEGVKSRMFRIR